MLLDLETHNQADELIQRYYRDLGPRTLKKYSANLARLGNKAWYDYATEKRLRQNTAQVYRAAWCYHHAARINEILENLEITKKRAPTAIDSDYQMAN